MKFVPRPWTEEAGEALKEALGDGYNQIREEVKRGVCSLWEIDSHGFFITRYEQAENELVLVAWQGKNSAPVVEHLQGVAIENDIRSIRFHTQHNEKLISRFVSRWGFERVETIYRWQNGR